MRDRYGDVVRLKMGAIPLYLLSHSDPVYDVFVRNKSGFRKSRSYDFLRSVLGNGLVTLEGESWRRRRRMLQPFFSVDNLPELARTVDNVLPEFIGELDRAAQRPDAIDIYPLMQRITLAVSAKALFGADVRDRKGDFSRAVVATSRHAVARMESLIDWHGFLPTKQARDNRRAISVLNSVVDRVIRDGRAGRASGAILRRLLEAREADPDPISEDDLRDEVRTLLISISFIAIWWPTHLRCPIPKGQ